MKALTLAAVAVLAGCAVADHGIAFDEDDISERQQRREALAEWCHLVGPCISGRGGLMPAPGAPPLPAYTDHCGYLPPLYGDDC